MTNPRYLLVSHVPFGRTAQRGRFQIGDLWLEDLRAQSAAIRDAGMRLVVAAPLMDQLRLELCGSFNAVEIDPADHHFEFRPLPHYITLRRFLRARRELVSKLTSAIDSVGIVQMGYGGHPIGPGRVAWPIARRLERKCIWVFDGADPFPRLHLHAAKEPNPLKRLAKRIVTRRFEHFCRTAVSSADLVFAHNAAVIERFRSVWDEKRCHGFDRSFVTDATLINESQLAERQRRLLDASQPLRLVAAGRQIAIKGTDHVIRAMKIARDRGAKIEFDVMGDGDALPRFRALAAELGLADVVRFSGTVPYGAPLFDAWSSAHVMVITNLTAEISRNVLLAMSRGLPPIMYSNPGTDELIRRSSAGVVVAAGDVNALANALFAASQDRVALAQMCAAGLRLAQTRTLDATHRRRAELAAAVLFGAPITRRPRARAA
jgi:glycosyltransferase involved in cell wall biosynthesis